MQKKGGKSQVVLGELPMTDDVNVVILCIRVMFFPRSILGVLMPDPVKVITASRAAVGCGAQGSSGSSFLVHRSSLRVRL